MLTAHCLLPDLIQVVIRLIILNDFRCLLNEAGNVFLRFQGFRTPAANRDWNFSDKSPKFPSGGLQAHGLHEYF